MKSVDVVMPSHMHDDHNNGFPHLVRHHGTRVWCLDNMVDIFQNPRGYNLGCILGEPFKVERSFRHGEKFRWEEFEFEVTHSPGHTEYQMALFVTVDGKRVAFTGDAFFTHPRNDGTLRHNLIFRNHVENARREVQEAVLSVGLADTEVGSGRLRAHRGDHDAW